jgi:uncharacterized protein (TIGR03663 family)
MHAGSSVEYLEPQTSSALVVPRPFEVSKRTFLIVSMGIMLLAAVLRLYALELKPMHHDEGVNGFFLTSLVRQGVYKYDPSNYHGPTLYYLALPLVRVFGLDNFSVRLLTVIAGLATILLMLELRRYIGTLATLFGAALIAVSPGAVFYSRYFIHESLFILFTLGIVCAALRFYESRRPVFLVFGVASAALLFATKETAFVSLIVLALAWVVAWLWTNRDVTFYRLLYSIFRFPISEVKKRKAKERVREAKLDSVDLQSIIARLGGRDRVVMLSLYAVGLFVFINILFYSSFFTNWPGVKGAFESLQIWTKTGTSQFHEKPFGTYITWLLQEEMPIFLLALGGAYLALFSVKINRFAVFIGAWAFGIFVAYSLIPYKTPWLMLSFIVPMAVVGGYALESLTRHTWGQLKAPIPALLIAGLAIAISGYQSLVLNFREYDNDQYPYVYAHTNRELSALVSEVERIAQRAGTKEIGVSIASPDNWPLPWYFRDYPRVGYLGTVLEHYDSKETPLVIGKESNEANQDQTAKLQAALGSDYEKLGSYTLRPGVRLALFARHDLAQR